MSLRRSKYRDVWLPFLTSDAELRVKNQAGVRVFCDIGLIQKIEIVIHGRSECLIEMQCYSRTEFVTKPYYES